MIASSEKIVSVLFENETEFDPYAEAPPVSTLEEVFFTGYIDGAQITMQEAMDFLTSGKPPRDIEEQLIMVYAKNRNAGIEQMQISRRQRTSQVISAAYF